MSYGHSAFSEAPFSALPEEAGAAISLEVDAGSYALTGTAAALERGYEAAGSAGSYALTGTAATLRKTSIIAAETVVATASPGLRAPRRAATSCWPAMKGKL